MSRNTKLKHLECGANQLTELDVSRHTDLIELHCVTNQLAVLNVGGASALSRLDCSYNQLTALNVSQNKWLTRLRCYDNLLTTFALNDLFRSLPGNSYGNSYLKKSADPEYCLYIINNPGASDCDVRIAEEKGWRVNPVDGW